MAVLLTVVKTYEEGNAPFLVSLATLGSRAVHELLLCHQHWQQTSYAGNRHRTLATDIVRWRQTSYAGNRHRTLATEGLKLGTKLPIVHLPRAHVSLL